MKISNIREMGAEELTRKEGEMAEELFRLRIRKSTGQLEKHSELGRIKRDIARIKTVRREKGV
ncbi:MAG: 50S ribosomal protein L29 [Deltaproteobacteria bacterium]